MAMADAEDMDLDSLMELLDADETFEEESTMNPSSTELNTSTSKEGPPPNKRAKVLRDAFEKDMAPKKVENPKPEEVYVRPALYKKDPSLFGDLDSSDEENEEGLTETGKLIKKEIQQSLNYSPTKQKGMATANWNNVTKMSNISCTSKLDNGRKKAPKLDTISSSKKMGNGMKFSSGSSTTKVDSSFIVDSYSGIRIVNPLVSFSVMQQRMEGRRIVKMSYIQNSIVGGDIEGDWVTIGVLISKSPPRKSKNDKTYSIWKMSDLHDPEKLVSVFLFKTAHTDHWKTTVGTVIGILNPSILPDKDKRGETSIAVDHPGKFMIMGKSKDLSFCKSVRKDGTPCNTAVNLFQCEYCSYHIRSEYKKFSSRRSELQSSYNGREPTLKNKLLKKQNVFYGGQTFTALGKKPNQIKSKDRLTLSNLGLKRKAVDALQSVEREKGVKKLTEIYGEDILKVAEGNSEFINAQLAKPTVGARNLLQHLMKDKDKDNESVKMITPKELMKMRDDQFSARNVIKKHRDDSLILQNLTPQIGRGLQPGQKVSLDFSSPRNINALDRAKLKAIQKIQEKGPIKRKDPNSVKVSADSGDKIKVNLEKNSEEKKDPVTENSNVVKSKLGAIDLNSEKVKAILNRKSSHAYEIEMAEMEKEAAYFNALEKKERMEEKMASTTEIVCNVISCKKCKYTAHSAAERCKNEGHPLKSHKALKRFFACKDCKKRTTSFTRIPTQSCRTCRGSNFERTSMMKPRSGPKLDSEHLNIRGEEVKFLNQMTSGKF